MNQSELEANTCNRREARENVREEVTCLVLRFLVSGRESKAFF